MGWRQSLLSHCPCRDHTGLEYEVLKPAACSHTDQRLHFAWTCNSETRSLLTHCPEITLSLNMKFWSPQPAHTLPRDHTGLEYEVLRPATCSHTAQRSYWAWTWSSEASSLLTYCPEITLGLNMKFWGPQPAHTLPRDHTGLEHEVLRPATCSHTTPRSHLAWTWSSEASNLLTHCPEITLDLRPDARNFLR